jgi:hypothetical protein
MPGRTEVAWLSLGNSRWAQSFAPMPIHDPEWLRDTH